MSRQKSISYPEIRYPELISPNRTNVWSAPIEPTRNIDDGDVLLWLSKSNFEIVDINEEVHVIILSTYIKIISLLKTSIHHRSDPEILQERRFISPRWKEMLEFSVGWSCVEQTSRNAHP